MMVLDKLVSIFGFVNGIFIISFTTIARAYNATLMYNADVKLNLARINPPIIGEPTVEKIDNIQVTEFARTKSSFGTRNGVLASEVGEIILSKDEKSKKNIIVAGTIAIVPDIPK